MTATENEKIDQRLISKANFRAALGIKRKQDLGEWCLRYGVSLDEHPDREMDLYLVAKDLLKLRSEIQSEAELVGDLERIKLAEEVTKLRLMNYQARLECERLGKQYVSKTKAEEIFRGFIDQMRELSASFAEVEQTTGLEAQQTYNDTVSVMVESVPDPETEKE